MPIKLGKDQLYTQDEVLKEVNTGLGEDRLSPQMFAYLRDIRKILPKPIRLKTKAGRGGAHSYYTDTTITTLKEILRQYIKMDQTINEISVSMRPAIDRMIQVTETLRPHIEQFQRIVKRVGEDYSKKMAPVAKMLESADWNKIGRDAIREEVEVLEKAFEDGVSDSDLESKVEELLSTYVRWKNYRARRAARAGLVKSEKK